MQANSGDPDETPHSVASDLGLHCLPMSNKKETRLKRAKSPFNNMHLQLSYMNACPTSVLLNLPVEVILASLSISKQIQWECKPWKLKPNTHQRLGSVLDRHTFCYMSRE